MDWQTVSQVVGFVGGLLGIVAVVIRLVENHQLPSVRLHKLPGDGNDHYVVEVVNPSLAPVPVREAGLMIGSKKKRFHMTELGQPVDTSFEGRRKGCSFVLQPRTATRSSFMRTQIDQFARDCGANTTDGEYSIAAYCDLVQAGWFRRSQRQSRRQRVPVSEARE